MFKKDLIDINTNPLQTSSEHNCIKTVTVAGPSKEGDRRFYLDAATLQRLLDIAKSSLVQRVQIDRAGVQVKLYQQNDGHTYEVWSIVGLQPKPESTMDGLLAKP